MIRILFISLLIGAPLLAGPQDWANWRGPNHDGSTAAEGLPIGFGPDNLVRWAAPMPGPGASTPIVVGDRIFLTSVDRERERLVAMCLDRKTGEVQWAHDAGSGYRPDGRGTRVAAGRRATYASPSPATDGERVLFFFGNGDLVAYDLAGEELWRRNVQKEYGNFAFNWTFASSPTYFEGLFHLPVLQRDEPIRRRRGRRRNNAAEPEPKKAIDSYLLGMDPATGKNVYRHVRPSPAQVESLESYTTLIPWTADDGQKQLLLAGGDVLTGHDPKTGEEKWRWGTWNEAHRERFWRLVPSVVTGGGVALVCAPKRAPTYAVKLGGRGELSAEELVWRSEGRPNPVSSDVPTPAFHDGHFYVLSDVRRALSKVAAVDGEVVWSIDMPGDHLWRASPTVADGRVWCMNHNGLVVVVDAGSGEVVHAVAMGSEDDDLVRSSVVVAYNSLFIRTNDKLYCIGS